MSNDPAAPENNRHHTESYRSQKDWLSQFDPDPATGEPNVFTPDVVARMNAELQAKMGDPIDLDNWIEELNSTPPLKAEDTAAIAERLRSITW